MLIRTRKHGSQRPSAYSMAKVTACITTHSESIVIEDHGPTRLTDRPTYMMLTPESLQEIAELEEWLKACKRHLSVKKAGAAG